MIAEKAADLLRETDTVKAIKDYFKHLIAVKHKRFEEEDDSTTTGVESEATHVHTEKKNGGKQQQKKKTK
jgi:hypothetical protein